MSENIFFFFFFVTLFSLPLNIAEQDDKNELMLGIKKKSKVLFVHFCLYLFSLVRTIHTTTKFKRFPLCERILMEAFSCAGYVMLL